MNNKKLENFSIRFHDLVVALSELSGIAVENMDIRVFSDDAFFVGDYDKMEMGYYANKNKCSYNVLIASYDKNKNLNFCYNIKMPIIAEKEQADGKSLLDHCRVDHFYIPDYNPNEMACISYLEFDQNSQDLLLEISSQDLEKERATCFPKQLLLDAISKCSSLKNNNIKVKE